MIAGYFTSFLPWMVWHNPTCSKKGCWSVRQLILVFLLWASGRGTWIIGHLILMCIHESATANAYLIINGAPLLQREPWSRVRHTSFLDSCFLTFLRTLSTAWRASEFVATPYKLKHWLGLTIPPLLVTCTILMTYKISSMSFSTAPIHRWSLSAGLMHLCFIPQVSTICLLLWARTTMSYMFFFMQ